MAGAEGLLCLKRSLGYIYRRLAVRIRMLQGLERSESTSACALAWCCVNPNSLQQSFFTRYLWSIKTIRRWEVGVKSPGRQAFCAKTSDNALPGERNKRMRLTGDFISLLSELP